MMRKSSIIWCHFNEKEASRAECKYCKVILSTAGGSTGNLARHLKKKHVTVPLERATSNLRSRSPTGVLSSSTGSVASTSTSSTGLSQEGSAVTPPEASEISNVSFTSPPNLPHPSDSSTPSQSSYSRNSSQSSIENFIQIIKPIPLNKTKAIDSQLLKMICKEYHPFSLVEDPEFKKLIYLLCPGYTLPSRKTLSNSLLPLQYNSLVQQIEVNLKSTFAVALTTDSWTSLNNQSFLAITAHYIDEDSCCIKSHLLGCIAFDQSHTAANLASCMYEECIKWGISNKITAVVTDNAANIVAAVRSNKWRHIPCMAHTLNLVVKEGIKPMEPILEKVKALVQYFKKSAHALAKLHETQKQMGLPQLKLKQEVPTRWNSCYDMVQRVFQNKAPILATLAVLQNDNFKISNDEWEVIEQVISLLKVFYDLTLELSSEKTVSLSKSFVLCRNLNYYLINYNKGKTLHRTVIDICNILQQQTQARLIFDTLDLIPQSAFLDPRFKKKSFKHCPAKYNLVYEALCGLVRGQIISSEQTGSGGNLDQEVADTMQGLCQVLWDDFDEDFGETIIKDPKALAIVEVDKYLAEPLIQRHKDPLQWWGERKSSFPHLFKVVLKRLCIPASSVPCERIFSKAGQILTDRRSRLAPSKLSKIMFLNYNL